MTFPAAALSLPTHAPGEPARFDIYAQVHKGLRAFLSDTLAELGRVDCGDDQALERALGQLDHLLDFCAGHLDKENRYVHAALEARQPGAGQRIANEHSEHVAAIDRLRAAAERLARSSPAERVQPADRLYRQLAVFVAENLEHMEVEESSHNALLWDNYSDAELGELHATMVAATSPEDLALNARWLAPSLRPAELAVLLRGVQASMPAEVFGSVVALVRPHLGAAAWQRLAGTLGLTDPTHSDSAAEIARRFVEATFVRFNADAAIDLITPDFLAHPWRALGLPAGPAGVRAVTAGFGAAFDEVSVTPLDCLVDGDRVALRYVYAGRHVGPLFGIAATGRPFRFEGIAILRLAGGKVAEFWREEDMPGLQRQLGAASLIAIEAGT